MTGLLDVLDRGASRDDDRLRLDGERTAWRCIARDVPDDDETGDTPADVLAFAAWHAFTGELGETDVYVRDVPDDDDPAAPRLWTIRARNLPYSADVDGPTFRGWHSPIWDVSGSFTFARWDDERVSDLVDEWADVDACTFEDELSAFELSAWRDAWDRYAADDVWRDALAALDDVLVRPAGPEWADEWADLSDLSPSDAPELFDAVESGWSDGSDRPYCHSSTDSDVTYDHADAVRSVVSFLVGLADLFSFLSAVGGMLDGRLPLPGMGVPVTPYPRTSGTEVAA